MNPVRIDTLVFGGGVAGLWTLHELLEAGVDAWLVETRGLGAAQSVQAQGIVHGGGKYALRRVGDVEAIRHIRAMPARWREHRAGSRRPSLAGAITSSDECWLWLPRGSWMSRLEALTLMPMLRHGGVLASPPRGRPREDWPSPLQAHALRAYSMDEPVLEPVSVIRALADPVRDRLLLANPVGAGDLSRSDEGFRVRLEAANESQEFLVRQIVACAGAGNAGILAAAGHDPARMQRRPLRMGLIRGRLPALHGHCVLGGRTRVPITSIDIGDDRRGWQVGGELSEQWADTTDDGFFMALGTEIDRALPGLSLSGMEVADYAAVRAEAANDAMSRPSGVQVEVVQDGLIVAWPTKWAMAPLLAEEIAGIVVPGNSSIATPAVSGQWPRAEISRPPWEQATWRNANSEQPV